MPRGKGENVVTDVLHIVQVCPWEPTEPSVSKYKMGLVPGSTQLTGVTAKGYRRSGGERCCHMRDRSLTNFRCGHGQHCRSAEHGNKCRTHHLTRTSLLSVKGQPQTLCVCRGGRLPLPTPWEPALSLAVTVCGSWAQGATSSWDCGLQVCGPSVK